MTLPPDSGLSKALHATLDSVMFAPVAKRTCCYYFIFHIVFIVLLLMSAHGYQ